MSASLVLPHSSIHSSTVLFSRTHFPLQTQREFPAPELCSVTSQSSLCFRNQETRKRVTRRVKATAVEPEGEPERKKVKILVAGGGIGGLVFALAAKKKGFEVVVFERDLSAIRGEGQYRGPIQIQSNALAALEAIDMDVADEIMSAGCITGDRINGLVDGISGNWVGAVAPRSSDLRLSTECRIQNSSPDLLGLHCRLRRNPSLPPSRTDPTPTN